MLTQLRTNIVTALTEAGQKSAEYVAETITPPITVVVPGEPYLLAADGDVPFGHMTVRFDLLVVGHKGTSKASAAGIDTQIEQVAAVLSTDWDIERVSQPGEVTLSRVTYIGAVISITQIIKEP